jgi:hypothetical protein
MVLTHRATGVAALATTLAPGRAFQLLEVRMHLSAAGGAGNFTSDVDAGAGSGYDLNIITQDMTAVVNFIFQPDYPMHFDAADEIDFAWANAGGKTYGLEVKYSLI